MNDGNYGFVVFLDFQRVFDTVDHSILLGKLRHYGVRGIPLRLINSFLENRKQCVTVSDHKSNIFDISIGTRQGSTLSPLLF